MESLKEWIINENEVYVYKNQILGKGQFGTVYKGEWRGLIVAIKQFEKLDANKRKLVENEFTAMTKIHHPNIIQLLGIIQNPFSIVMEYIPNGCLFDYLNNHQWTSLDRKVLFMMDIAKGLAYLHARKPSFIIHRDIKPKNFLVTKDLQIKIADFGICKILKNDICKKSQENLQYITDITATSNVGTLYYMAPELVVKEKITHYTASVDIYSFGSVMYEIFEGHKIYEFCENREQFINIILRRCHPNFEHSRPFIKKLIIRCLDYKRSKKWWLKLRF